MSQAQTPSDGNLTLTPLVQKLISEIKDEFHSHIETLRENIEEKVEDKIKNEKSNIDKRLQQLENSEKAMGQNIVEISENLQLLEKKTEKLDLRLKRQKIDYRIKNKIENKTKNTMEQNVVNVFDNLRLLETKTDELDNRIERQNASIDDKMQQLQDANKKMEKNILTKMQGSNEMEQPTSTSIRNYRNLRRTISWDMDDDTKEVYNLDQDVYGIMMLTPPLSKTWILGLISFTVQATLGLMVVIDQTRKEFLDTPYNIPLQTNFELRITQFLVIILAIMTQTDVLIGLKMILTFPLRKQDAWKELINFRANAIGDEPTNRYWYLNILFPNTLKVTEGLLILYASFVVIIQTDTVVDLLKDYSALYVISSIDNVLFTLANEGYFGTESAYATLDVKEKKVKDHKEDVQRSLVSVLAVMILTCLLLWTYITILQHNDSLVALKYPLCLVEEEIGFDDHNRTYKSLIRDEICQFPKGTGPNILDCGWEGGDCYKLNERYENCDVDDPSKIGDKNCDWEEGLYNSKNCGFDDGDCVKHNEKIYKEKIKDNLKCIADFPDKLGDEFCDAENNTPQCENDAGDCDRFNEDYPNCRVDKPENVKNNNCDGGAYNTLECEYDGGDCAEFNELYPNCNAENPEWIRDSECNEENNSKECGWDGGDCLIAGFPNCHVDNPDKVGDKVCDGPPYNREECGWEKGDCRVFNQLYPNCRDGNPNKVRDGVCDREYNIEECKWDGGDCLINDYPNCHVDRPNKVGDSVCDAWLFPEHNSAECGWDGGDCLIDDYPECHVNWPDLIGNGVCGGGEYNTPECGWDGGDCTADGYPDCHVDWPALIGDGFFCDLGAYNTAECGWDGGDCTWYNEVYPTWILDHPNCNVDKPEWIGDGWCYGPYNTEECGWDGGDCLEFNQDFPDCLADFPFRVGDENCNGGSYNTSECGWDGGDCP